MKKLMSIIAFCLLLAGLFSMPVSQNEAVGVATNWMNQISISNAVSGIETLSNPQQNNLADMYVINFSQGGFVVISGDDTASPILGYDPSSTFKTTDMPDNMTWFISQYHEQYSMLRSMDNVSEHPDWQTIRAGNFTGYLPNRAVTPLLQTNWDQGWPYNSLCPSASMGPGGHVYAGCGATTMGQIMKYWAHPTQGVGSHTYTHSTYGTLTANFGATTYNFSAMPNELNWTPNTAISTLLLHCGIALDMDYGADGSGASTSALRGAFVNYFNYESTAQTLNKSAYTATAWDNLLKNELDNGRPVFYFGTDTLQGGHAFVCDGYQGTNYFHMNWGWSGSNNGYFYLSNLNPDMFHFNSQQGAVIGLQPTVPVAAPTNLTATLDFDNCILLEWQSPAMRSLMGFSIYRNGVYYANLTDPGTTNYYDINLEAGTYEYYLIANFSQGASQPSNTASAIVFPAPVINYQDSFESYSSFNASPSPWFNYDLDLSPTVNFSNIDFPTEGEPHSFMVLKPSATTPPLTDFSAYSGQKLLASLGAINSPNNDWIVSPQWNTGALGRLKFWAKSAYPNTTLEKIKIGVNTLSPEPAGMTIISGQNPISVPGTWTEYDFTLSNYLDACVFVGIQCVSNNGSMLLLDRVQLWTTYVDNEDNTVSEISQMKLKAYPNPFADHTNIVWQQKDIIPASIRIYDVKGQLVKTLMDRQSPPGNAQMNWNGVDNNGNKVAAGLYFCKLKDNAGRSFSQKLIKLK